MDKIKLDTVLFEFMEGTPKEKIYNYELFIRSLSAIVDYFNKPRCKDSDWEVLAPYFSKKNREETLEKLLKAFIFGYEEKDDRYTIVLFKRDGFEFVLWEVDCKYEVGIKEEYHEDEVFRKTFTRSEILNKFPELWPLAQKSK